MDTIGDLDSVGRPLVDSSVPECELAVVAFLRLLEAELLFHLQVGVGFAVDLEFELVLEAVEVFAVVCHALLHDFYQGVVVAEAERELRLAQILGDEDLLALFDLDEK